MDSQGKFIVKYTELLNNRSVLAANGNCRILNSKDKSGYGRINVTFLSGIKKLIYAHRLIYFLNIRDIDGLENGNLHCSHICHNTKCINPVHISLEEPFINQERKICVKMGHCRGHQNYAACLLHFQT